MSFQAALAHTHLLILIALQICLNNFNPSAVGDGLQPFDVRIFDQEFALDLVGFRFPEEGGNFGDQTSHLILKTCGIINHAKVRVSRPGGDQFVIYFRGFLGGLGPCGVICSRIKFLCALCRRHQMKNGIVGVSEFDFVGVQVFEYICEFQTVHIGLIVKRAPVAHDQDLGGVHCLRAQFKYPFFFELQAEQALLELAVRCAGPRRDAPGDQFRRRFRDEEDGVAHLREGVLNPAHRGRLSGAGAARDHNFGDFCLRPALDSLQEVIHADAEDHCELPELVDGGLGFADFPFGDGLVADAKFQGQFRLAEACALSQFIDVVAEAVIVHLFFPPYVYHYR